MLNWAQKIVGSQNERVLRKLLPQVEAVAQLEPQTAALGDAALQAKTPAFRERLQQGEALDALLPEAFAVVREAMKRTIGKRHFDVQILGGAILHQGKIAEMKTGEGKTFVALLPAYLNALAGGGVHVVTVNDYLARRDAEWMGAVHNFLGLGVGCVVPNLPDAQRAAAYQCDITYGTNNEFGFDYLRDNMKPSLDVFVQRKHNFAIVDEVDSILIDEARTPLIISGQAEQETGIYGRANAIIPRLKKGVKADPKTDKPESGDYWVDEEHSQSSLTEAGTHTVEKLWPVQNLYAPDALPVLHAVGQALQAHALKKRDVHYVVQAGEKGREQVVIVDEFTGRLMPGRRWADGLHQAVEAKEGIKVQSESQTLASVTFQNYFRMYKKLSGMTGTADTEAAEFAKIYNLDVVVAPTHLPMVRDDLPDVVYKSEREKFNAVVEEIRERHGRGQPVLVGTISIEDSERLAKRLKKKGIRHNVLNAKHHEREAEIVAQAGRKNALTISTNMAGRGTDILLGGNPEQLALQKCKGDPAAAEYPQALAYAEAQCAKERAQVIAAGGLHILGTERHESRRIDHQLRGRAGRQGDPGSSQFFLSLEDDLLRIFGGARIQPWMERLGLEEGEAIEHKMITRAIENAQKKVEGRNFETRKVLLDYDNVMNLQRSTFYGKRRELLDLQNVHEELEQLLEGVVVELLDESWPEKTTPGRDELSSHVDAAFGDDAFNAVQHLFAEGAAPAREEFGRAMLSHLKKSVEEKREFYAERSDAYVKYGLPKQFTEFVEQQILLPIMDRQWKDHLHAMDALRDSIGFRGMAQRDPKLEYQREGFAMFEAMNRRVDFEAAQVLLRLRLPEPEQLRPRPPPPPPPAAGAASAGIGRARGAALPPGRLRGKAGKVGANAPCPCGSGKKFKKCCGP